MKFSVLARRSRTGLSLRPLVARTLLVVTTWSVCAASAGLVESVTPSHVLEGESERLVFAGDHFPSDGRASILAGGPVFVSYGLLRPVSHVAVDGTVGCAASGSELVLLDTSHPGEPSPKGILDLGEEVIDLVLSGKTAFVLHEDDPWGLDTRISVVDIADLNAPRVTSVIGGYRKLTGLDHSEGHLYVAGWNEGLLVFDLEDPGNPQLVGKLFRPGWPRDVAVEGGRAFLAIYSKRVDVIDVSDPHNPEFSSKVSTEHDLWSVEVAGDLVVALSTNSVFLFEAIHGKRPRLLRTRFFARLKSASIWNDALLAVDQQGLTLIDVSDPEKAAARARQKIEWGSASSVAVAGSHAYVGSGEGLLIYDISSPFSPGPESVADSVPAFDHMALEDDILVTGRKHGGEVMVFEIRPGGEVSGTGSLDLDTDLNDLALERGLALFASRDGLLIADVGSPGNPTVLYEGSGILGQEVHAVEASGSLLYVQTGASLLIVDITEPSQPRLVSEMASRAASWMTYDGGFLYKAGRYGVGLYDVTDPEHPRRAGGAARPDKYWTGQAMDACNGLVYMYYWVGEVEYAVLVYRREADGELVEVSHLHLGGNACSRTLFAHEDRLFVGVEGHLAEYDFSDPGDPWLVTSYPVNWDYGCPQSAQVSSDRLFLRFWRPSLVLFRRNPTLFDQWWDSEYRVEATLPPGYSPGPYHARFRNINRFPGALENELRICSRRSLESELNPLWDVSGPQVELPVAWSFDLTSDNAGHLDTGRSRGILLLPEGVYSVQAIYLARPDSPAVTVEVYLGPVSSNPVVRVLAPTEDGARVAWESLLEQGGIPLPPGQDHDYAGFYLFVTDRAPSALPGSAQQPWHPSRSFLYELKGGLLHSAVARGRGADLVLAAIETYEQTCEVEQTTSYRSRVAELCRFFDAGEPGRAFLCPDP